VPCAESPRIGAYFDGELDAVAATLMEGHLESCAECRSCLEDLQNTRDLLRREVAYSHAPPQLRARILRALDEQAGTEKPSIQRRTFGRRPFLLGAFSGVAGTAMAAAAVLFLLTPRLTNPLLEDVVSAHVRSLMPDHLIDVVSTDKHTVKPWFAGHADVSPVVADFDQQGYRLIGGRADYFDHQRAAVVVYQHGAHVINVFSWAATSGSLPKDATRNGYHLAFWKSGNLMYCAVSDTAWDELLGLVKLLQDLGDKDNKGS
jgi:anti-sigma factor RsiW